MILYFWGCQKQSMKKTVIALLSLLLISETTEAQLTRYLVKFKHKGGTPFTIANPAAYLSQRAIDRRTRYGIAIDSTDLPVTPSFIAQIAAVPGVTILNISKWLNQVSIDTNNINAIATINTFPFVQSIIPLAAKVSKKAIVPVEDKFSFEERSITATPQQRTTQTTADFFNYGSASFNEINLHKGQFLHNIGLRGQGMQIAVLDGGFFNYQTLDAMDSIIINNQVLGTWDFVSGNTNVNDDHPHGMQCLSTIAANIPGVFMGKAPKANFYLYRTEDVASEFPIEEHNMVCGMEKADSTGADIISASLGYFEFDDPSLNYTYANMNGNTTISAKGADLAAKKGILFFNAAGNEGNGAWHFIITPSDADSVVAVGAVGVNGFAGTFTSLGPSSDGQVKPEVASIGVSARIQTTSNTVAGGNGTSFACPNMAGMGTCLWQGFPEYNNMRIIRALKEAGNRFTNPNDSIGYGIPNMRKAFGALLRDYATSSATLNVCNVTMNWSTKDMSAMRYEIERKAPGDIAFVKIADVTATAGNALLGNRNYQFINTLTNVSSGAVEYRIKQFIDTSAAELTFEYIDTATINLTTACTTTGTGGANPNSENVTVFPNPSSSVAYLVVETPYAVPQMTILIHDSKGRLVHQLKTSKGSGKATIEIPYLKFGKGKYYITVYNDKKVLSTEEWINL
jgi:serine protease AprX